MLRITGIKEETGESTDDIVLNMAKALGANISVSDLDRSHRVGKPNPKPPVSLSDDTNTDTETDTDTEPAPPAPKPRAIIVKFATYRARQVFYKTRTKAKTNGYKMVFVNEDLTKYRNGLLFEARELVKGERPQGAFSSDGTILIKDNGNNVFRVMSVADLARF